ncbi:DMT family transporter [Pontiellaceae bacterium B12219]|nr:DMT family transporter [Pontiellaceae bacterium B12219]
MTWILTAIALIAFAANSLLCRLALADKWIDPLAFTALRLISGMLVLIPVSRFFRESVPSNPWKNARFSGFALFIYALTFSLGYVSIGAGIGTLILVGAVQITMLGWALIRKEQIHAAKWIGSLVSMAGLIYLVSPGLAAPDPAGAALMLAAGAAWGIYSIRGRGATAPILMTTRNFICAVPPILLIVLFRFQTLELSAKGAAIAICSGALMSGLGYVVWYRALRHLSTSSASILQLLVPILAALGGILFLNEAFSLRLTIASALILGGVAMGFFRRQ